MAKKNNMSANTILQNYMMERLLERISISPYKDNFILKGGFLIASIVGIDMRSTLDIDTTLKGIPINQDRIEEILKDIFSVDVDDQVAFQLMNIKTINDHSKYNNFRVSTEACFFSIKVNLKIDITTGDKIIPSEIAYSFKLMFEDRHISVKAYNLNTILAEKVESILARNVSNTRARDFYDVYILLKLKRNDINSRGLREAIREKAEERNTLVYIENHEKYLNDINESKELLQIWDSYKDKYPYAGGIEFQEITNMIRELLNEQQISWQLQ